MCEKHAAEHQMFVSSYQELIKWLETCREQLISSDVTKDTADHWVCVLYTVIAASCSISIVLYFHSNHKLGEVLSKVSWILFGRLLEQDYINIRLESHTHTCRMSLYLCSYTFSYFLLLNQYVM